MKETQLAAMLDSPIKQITLRKSITSPEWVSFEDEDLIRQWTDYFKNLEIKHQTISKQMADPNLNGGGMAVIIFATDSGEYSIGLYTTIQGSVVLDIGGHTFATRSSSGCPFESTYVEAVTRHGTVSPWD